MTVFFMKQLKSNGEIQMTPVVKNASAGLFPGTSLIILNAGLSCGAQVSRW